MDIIHNNNNNTISTTTSFWWEQDPVLDMFMIGDIDHDQTTAAPDPAVAAHVNPLEDEKDDDEEEEEEEELGDMKEMMYKIAAMQPVNIDPTTIHKPKRRNVRISEDPQSVAARRRRERISEKIRILQRLVPGGTKMDTASMLDEAVRYLKFLKRQIKFLQTTTLEEEHHHLILNPTRHGDQYHWPPPPPLFFDPNYPHPYHPLP